MNDYVIEYLNERINGITENLSKTNSEFSSLLKRTLDNYEIIEEKLLQKNEIINAISYRNLLKSYLDDSLSVSCIMQREAYIQGYLDHLRLIMAMTK